MFTAYILINTEIGHESHVLEALKKVEGVEEAHNLWGVYDIIASIKAENGDRLKFIVTNMIKKIKQITVTSLLITET